MLQGIFPQQLKRAFFVPVPKASPPRSIEEDLRPISHTSQMGKVMEGFTLDSLLSEVSVKLDTKQFAMPRKSTTQALVYILHLIYAGSDIGHCYARLFFADFRKGFDLVDHNDIIILHVFYGKNIHLLTITIILERNQLTNLLRAPSVLEIL